MYVAEGLCMEFADVGSFESHTGSEAGALVLVEFHICNKLFQL